MITLLREELAEALKGFRLLKRKKGATKASLAIRIEPKPQALCLSALCLDNTLTYSMAMVEPAPEGKPLHLNMDHLEAAVKGADKKTTIRIDLVQSLIRYQTKGVEIEHAFHPVSDKPEIETALPDAQFIPFPEDVMEAIAEASVCASTDETRYILNGVHVRKGEVAATNGRKLYNRKTGSLPLPEEGVTIPLHPVLKLFTCGGTVMFRLGPKPEKEGLDRRFQMSSGPWTWGAFLVKGNYPNYRQVIPREDESRTRVEVAEEDALKLIEILPQLPGMKDRDSSVTLESHGGTVTVIAESDGSENRVDLESTKVPSGAGDILTRFNRTFLREALQQGFRVLMIKDELSAVSMEDREKSRLFLWMPLRVDKPYTPPQAPDKPTETETESETQPVSHNRLSPVQAGAQTTERNPTPMAGNRINNNGNGSPVAASNGSHGNDRENGTNGTEGTEDPIARVQEGLARIREMLRDLTGVVQEVNASLKDAGREHKALEKEHRSLRRNLRSLKTLDV